MIKFIAKNFTSIALYTIALAVGLSISGSVHMLYESVTSLEDGLYSLGADDGRECMYLKDGNIGSLWCEDD